MPVTKRSTVRIEEDLMGEIRRRAAAEHVSINRMINRLLRRGLYAPESKSPRFQQEAYDMGEPRVDVTKAHALLAALDDQVFMEKMKTSKKR